jgi:hypothetical protein
MHIWQCTADNGNATKSSYRAWIRAFAVAVFDIITEFPSDGIADSGLPPVRPLVSASHSETNHTAWFSALHRLC